MISLTALGFSQPAITLSPAVGPPTTTTLVSGSGFSPSAYVDIYFDSTDLAPTVTDNNGSFSKIALHVPASALPGKHWVKAVDSTGASAQAPFLVQTVWPQFRRDPAHTAYDPYENILSPETVGDLRALWKYTTGATVWSSPAVANGRLYFGSDDGRVYALDTKNGALLWKYATAAYVWSSPAVANGVVYVGSGATYGPGDHNVYGLNAATGGLLWKYTTGGDVQSSPVVANGVVYVTSADNNVYALNASTGALLWKYAGVPGSWSSPAVDNGVVYVGSGDGYVYALNASSGALVWRFKMTAGTNSSPAAANGVVYVGSGLGDDNLYALDAGTGALKWKYTTGAGVDSSPAVADGVVYVGSYDGNVYALNGGSGTLLWEHSTGYGAVFPSPAVANGVVYVGSDSNAYALDAGTGTLLWKYQGDKYISSPAVADGVVYIASSGGTVYAFGLPGGGGPAVTLTPASVTFQVLRTVGSASATQTVKLTNLGSAELDIAGITVTGSDSGDFAQSNNCPPTVASGGSCLITVTFTPTAQGVRTASVSMADSAPDSPQAVPLTGRGTFFQWSPRSLNLGDQKVGSSSAAQTVTLTNAGPAPITLFSVGIGGINAGDFSETNTCGSSLNPRASCTIEVTFTPTAVGGRIGHVAIRDSAFGGTHWVGLLGNGVGGHGVCTPPPSGMTDWWPGDGNAKDLLGRCNGVIQGGLTFTPGEVAKAFTFNGVDAAVKFGPAGDFARSDFTVDFWLRMGPSIHEEGVLEKRPSCSHGQFYGIRTDDTRVGHLEVEVDDGEGHYIDITTSRAINDGGFHLIALVRQGRTVSVYIDGTRDSTATMGAVANVSNSAPLTAGKSVCDGRDGTVPLKGQIDEIELFTRALAVSEIQAIYEAGSGGKCKKTRSASQPRKGSN
jgi:outer membrane protein assembly factor BamB